MKLITGAHRVLSLPATTYARHRTVKATDFLSRERRSILQQSILVIVEEPIKHRVEEKSTVYTKPFVVSASSQDIHGMPSCG